MIYEFEKPVNAKFYFTNDKTRNYNGITKTWSQGNWMMLNLVDGKEVMINSSLVVLVEMEGEGA